MSHPLYHARSSAKKFGGTPEPYLKVHQFFDQTKAHVPSQKHRLILHNSFGIFLAEQVFGPTIKNSLGQDVPTSELGRQHVLEDLQCIPTLAECLENTPEEDWIWKRSKKLSQDKSLNEQNN